MFVVLSHSCCQLKMKPALSAARGLPSIYLLRLKCTFALASANCSFSLNRTLNCRHMLECLYGPSEAKGAAEIVPQSAAAVPASRSSGALARQPETSPSPGHRHQMVKPEKKKKKSGGIWENTWRGGNERWGERGWKAPGFGLLVGFLRVD